MKSQSCIVRQPQKARAMPRMPRSWLTRNTVVLHSLLDPQDARTLRGYHALSGGDFDRSLRFRRLPRADSAEPAHTSAYTLDRARTRIPWSGGTLCHSTVGGHAGRIRSESQRAVTRPRLLGADGGILEYACGAGSAEEMSAGPSRDRTNSAGVRVTARLEVSVLNIEAAVRAGEVVEFGLSQAARRIRASAGPGATSRWTISR
jgi:hypothetical protein